MQKQPTMTKVNIALGLAVVALVITVYSLFGGHVEKALFGSTSCANITCLSGGLRLVADAGGDFESDVAAVFNSTFKLGSSGTVQANQVSTTCAMKANLSTTATTTNYAFCTGVTGLTSSDNVIAQFASSTGATALADNWVIVSAKASTTAGAVDFAVLNLTGGTATQSAVSKIGSTTALWISH